MIGRPVGSARHRADGFAGLGGEAPGRFAAHALPHHDGSALYVSGPEPGLGDRVGVRVRIPAAWDVDTVAVRSDPDREPRWDAAVAVDDRPGAADAGAWRWWQAEIVVANPVHRYRFLIRGADGSVLWLNAAGVHEVEPVDVEDFRLVAHPAPPEWVPDSVLYQVFCDRFARSAAADEREVPEWAAPASWDDQVRWRPETASAQFYGGDLDGAAEHLDHIAALGANLVYLTPFFPARSAHRYDASSFDEVDPLLGGDDALVRFVRAAHARGLRVIGDLTTNHCGAGHEWFRAALGRPDAVEGGFFYWLDGEHTRYESWLGVPSLPKLNWNSRELRRRFIEGPDSVVARWLAPPFDLDGWRIDVANMTGRLGAEDLNAEVRRTIRRTMIETKPETILLGEYTNDAAGDMQGDAWHGAMTYAGFTRPVWGWLTRPRDPASEAASPIGVIPHYSAAQLVEAHTRFTAGYPWRTRLGTMNALDTHDLPRFAGYADDAMLPPAVGLSATLPGIPVVWAGDEFALTGVNGEASRTPMPWRLLSGDDGADGRDGADGAVVAAADGGPGGAGALPEADRARRTVALYRAVLRVRRGHPALRHGGLRWLHAGGDALVFVREHPEETVVAFATRAAATVALDSGELPPGSSSGAVRLLGDAELADGAVDTVTLHADGPSFTLWALPAPSAPAWRPRAG